MAERSLTVRERAGELLVERRKALREPVAEMLGHPTGAEELPPKEERRLFWKRAISEEQEAALWDTKLAELGRPMTDEEVRQFRVEIAPKVHPRRWEMFARQGGLPEAVKWARRMERLGPPDDGQGDEGEGEDAGSSEPAY